MFKSRCVCDKAALATEKRTSAANQKALNTGALVDIMFIKVMIEDILGGWRIVH